MRMQGCGDTQGVGREGVCEQKQDGQLCHLMESCWLSQSQRDSLGAGPGET